MIRLLSICLSALFFVACTGKGKKSSNKTLVYCSEGSPSSFNSQVAVDGTTYNITARQLSNRLVEFKLGTTEIVPALAESWEVSADKLTYTFKLRKDVQFHTTKYFKPTRNFNADDVIFSYNRMAREDHPFHKVSGGNYEYFDSMNMNGLVKEVKKIDDYTVQFVLNEVNAPFIANMAMEFNSILSKEYGDQLLAKGTPEQIDTLPVSTGPFKFIDYQKDTLVRLAKHENYFRGPAKIDNLIFAITPDASVRFQKLKAGECHFVTEPSPTDLAGMKSDPQIQLVSQPGLNVGYLAMNTKKKPFDNVKVRQAMAYALNRKAYIDAIYLGNASVAHNPIPPKMWSYNTSVEKYEHNVEKAKKLLAEAGYPDGFETELWTLPVSRPYNPSGKKMGELMQADLVKVGIKAKLVSYDWPTYLKKSQAGEHDLAQFGWSADNGDPDNFLATLLSCASAQSGQNRAFWCNQEFDALVIKAQQITEIAKRTELYKKAQEIFKTQVPWVPIAHSENFRAYRENLAGYTLDPFAGDYFHKVELK